MGKLIGIASCDNKGEDMVVNASAHVSLEKGVGADHHGALENKDRQVTIMTVESWDEVCKELGSRLHWTMRRANLLIEGIDLQNTTGEYIGIGKCIIQITGEFKPGRKVGAQFNGLKDALTPNWRGGVTGKVVVPAVVKENEPVVFMEKA